MLKLIRYYETECNNCDSKTLSFRSTAREAIKEAKFRGWYISGHKCLCYACNNKRLEWEKRK